MRIPIALKIIAPLLVVLALAVLVVEPRALPRVAPQPAEVQGQSFSVAANDPLTLTGFHPADILGIGGLPLIGCRDLGLLCEPATPAGPPDDIQALSYGWDFIPMDLPASQFSVAPGALGASGTAVNIEAVGPGCSPPGEPQADVFESALDGGNVQDLDGDGIACDPANDGYGLILNEGPGYDNIDALGRDPCKFVDYNCNSYPEYPIFFSLGPGSPSLEYLGFSTSDILIAGIGYMPRIWANGVGDLRLDQDDEIDAICVWDNGNGVYDAQDNLLFSLATGSPTLTTHGFSPADLLRNGERIGYSASRLGLEYETNDDDVDALTCSFEYTFSDLFLPIIYK